MLNLHHRTIPLEEMMSLSFQALLLALPVIICLFAFDVILKLILAFNEPTTIVQL